MCRDESFDAHKAILASQSPVLRKMFEVEMKEKHSNVIEIVDLDPSVVSDLLSFLYTGTVPNMKENAEELLRPTCTKCLIFLVRVKQCYSLL